MPLAKKTFQDFFNLVIGKFRKEVPTIDATIKASVARGSSGASAIAATALQEGIQDVVNQSFWQTADDDFLELIGEYDETVRFEAEVANGFCAVEGVLNTLVAANTNLNAQGNTYIVLQDAFVQDYSGDVSLSFSGSTVTAVTSSVHSLSTGLNTTISGATQGDYNGTFLITVLDENTFTYELTAGFLTNDNGTYTSTYALLDIESEEAGTETNLDSGATLSIDVTDIDDTAYVGVGGISGGLEEEEIEEYRERVGESHSLTPGIATEPSEVFSAKKIAGNTRIFVVRASTEPSGTPGTAGYVPDLGETVIYVLRDNDQNIIPNQAQLDETKAQILDDGLWPTLVPVENLYVIAPTLLEQDFVFTSITPNTSTMQNAIRDQLDIFFEDNAEVGSDPETNYTYTIEQDQINAFLRQVQDVTGAFLQDFEYTTPSGDIVANSGEIYTRGTVTF